MLDEVRQLGYVVGLDVSTSCTGVAVIDAHGGIVNPKPLLLTHVEFKDCDDLWKKADKFREFVKSMDRGWSHVYVEESLMMFKPGQSSAQTLTTLTQFNALCCYIFRDVHGLVPKKIAAVSARKRCGINVRRAPVTTLTAKQQVQAWALSPDGPLSSWSFERNKKGNIKPQAYDEIDAYVIAMAGALLEADLIKTTDK